MRDAVEGCCPSNPQPASEHKHSAFQGSYLEALSSIQRRSDRLPTSTAAFRCDCFLVMQIRANILTESNIRDLVRLMDEEMDGVAAEQRERLESIEAELIEVRRRLDRVWYVIENSELDISDATSRIREHRERQEKLEIAAEEARALLSERRAVLDNVDTIAAFAEDMSDFLMTSEITESRAFIKSFVKEIKVKPGKATVYYTIPMSDDSPIPGRDAEELALHSPVLSTVKYGGPKLTVDRTIFELLLAL